MTLRAAFVHHGFQCSGRGKNRHYVFLECISSKDTSNRDTIRTLLFLDMYLPFLCCFCFSSRGPWSSWMLSDLGGSRNTHLRPMVQLQMRCMLAFFRWLFLASMPPSCYFKQRSFFFRREDSSLLASLFSLLGRGRVFRRCACLDTHVLSII